jgi:hypothetical protein
MMVNDSVRCLISLHKGKIRMAIQAAAAASFAPAPIVAAAAKADLAKTAAEPVANDADGDLQRDLATGENPYPGVGSNVNTKA